ncbi:unnamed protein product [Calypogeia fissa]
MVQELEFLPPFVQINKCESFATILERFAYLFGQDASGNEIDPHAIPLCRMQNLEFVRNLNSKGPGVSNCKDSFLVHGYVSTFSGFQLLLVDERGDVQPVADEIRSSWDPLWVQVNVEFEVECDKNPTYAVLKDRMFPVGDGNHCLFLCMKVCDEFANETKYHVRVKAKFLSGNDVEMMQIYCCLQAFNS